MTGLPFLALDAYQSSIDALKQANDLLWLAGSFYCFVIFSSLADNNDKKLPEK